MAIGESPFAAKESHFARDGQPEYRLRDARNLGRGIWSLEAAK
jgi:hypothetical protein